MSSFLDMTNKTKLFYFQIFKRTENISLTATLCGQSDSQPTIHIELYFINSKTIKKFHKRKIGRRSNDRQTQRIWTRMINRKLSRRSKNHRKLLVLEHLLHSSSSLLQQSRTTFGNGIVFQPGLYIIQMESNFPYNDERVDEKSDVPIQLYLNSKSNPMPYPFLPPVASILIQQVYGEFDTFNQSSAEIWWNPVISSDIHQNYEYCLVIQENYPYKDKCSSEIQLSEIRICSNQTKMTVHDLRPGQLYFVDVFVRNLNHLNGLQSKYWTANFTLIDHHTQQKIWREQFHSMQQLHDSLFTGVFLDSKNQYRKRFLFKLPFMPNEENNKLYIYIQPCIGLGSIQLNVEEISLNYFDQLRRKRHQHHRRQENFDMADNSIIDEIMDDYNPLTDSDTDNAMLFFEEIMETRTIELTIPVSYRTINTGMLYLIIELNTVAMMQSRSMVLLVTNSLSKFPFPRLPNDKSIRVMETLKQCDSVTLVWNASPDERVTYCILQRDAKYGHGFEESKHLCQKIKPPTINRRSSSPKDSDNDNDNNVNHMVVLDDRYLNEHSYPTRKVLCRRYRTQKRINNNLIMQQIKKLQPGRQYIFMITIKGRKNQLNYEQIYADTKDDGECSVMNRNNYMDDNDELDRERRKRWRGRSS
ncbi:protein NDNF isoform X2 [Dermatophagoides farinae]|uniref:protein NDNF isoform X2 n=1 Tax=Dermatophagoides farinae TaxID=6954 RepID=UPI003F5F40F9